jgi:predicted PurR-regulated permease PerM
MWKIIAIAVNFTFFPRIRGSVTVISLLPRIKANFTYPLNINYMPRQYPYYLKSTVIMLGLILFVFIIFTLRDILVPICFSVLIAILLNPLVNRLRANKVGQVASIVIALLIAFIFIAGVGYFLSRQIAGFSDQLPLMKQKLEQMIGQLQVSISQRFNIGVEKQQAALRDAGQNVKPWLSSTAGTVMNSLATMFLLPIYAYLFLYYKTLLLTFLYDVFTEDHYKDVGVVLKQTKGAVQSYMFGLLIEALIVAILNSLTLLLLGVKYWVLLGVLGAILNILPFIGGIISAALPVIIATITKDGFHTQLLIIIFYMIIQFIDNHFLVPYIVSSKVKINALISIIFVLFGNAVWGISGMFLSIPFAGILKIVFDRIEELKPWGKLLGVEVPTVRDGRWRQIRKRKVEVKVLEPAAE